VFFGRASGLQRLKNHSLYHEILLLQKFNDILGKVFKPKKISLQPQKKKLRPIGTSFKMTFFRLIFVSIGGKFE
jgi:hypothetical protein